jgi:uncharacterized protein YjbI with pentapeptide repeats
MAEMTVRQTSAGWRAPGLARSVRNTSCSPAANWTTQYLSSASHRPVLFADCSLREAEFTGCDLTGSLLDGCDLHLTASCA